MNQYSRTVSDGDIYDISNDLAVIEQNARVGPPLPRYGESNQKLNHCCRCKMPYFREIFTSKGYCPQCRSIRFEEVRAAAAERQRVKRQQKRASLARKPKQRPEIRFEMVLGRPVAGESEKQKRARLIREAEELTAILRAQRGQ